MVYSVNKKASFSIIFEKDALQESEINYFTISF